MKTIDIYTTVQCGFCQKLKSHLKSKNIEYTAHDVSSDKKILEEMQKLSNGSLSVPVTVLNKGKNDQEVFIGYPDIAERLELEEGEKHSPEKQEKAILTCPKCGHTQEGIIPTTACVPFYKCQGCQKIIESQGGDCCVFCSYADTKCPLKKDKNTCSDEVCSL